MIAAPAAVKHFLYTGGGTNASRWEGVVPRDATHVSIHPTITIIPSWLFSEHPNIVELRCHEGVKKIEEWAFHQCPSLQRVIMPGVEVIETSAFCFCILLRYIECKRLKIVGRNAFYHCESLGSIDIPSVKLVFSNAFTNCYDMRDVTFGKDLDMIRKEAFAGCKSLERITMPLKDGLFTSDDIFQACDNLKRVDLVEEEVLQETIATLLWDEWKDDLKAEFNSNSINHILSNASAGLWPSPNVGQKVSAIRDWIARVLPKVIHYTVQHRELVNAAAAAVQLASPNDVVLSNVLPYVELPLYTFNERNTDDKISSSLFDFPTLVISTHYARREYYSEDEETAEVDGLDLANIDARL